MEAVLFLVEASLVNRGENRSLVTTRGDNRWGFALVVGVSLAQGVSQGLLLEVPLWLEDAAGRRRHPAGSRGPGWRPGGRADPEGG